MIAIAIGVLQIAIYVLVAAVFFVPVVGLPLWVLVAFMVDWWQQRQWRQQRHWRQQRPPGRAILKKVASVHPLTESHCVTMKCDCAPVPDCVTV